MIEQEITLLTNGRISFQKCGNGLQFGYSKNRGVYSIKVKTSGEWNGLTIRAFWHIPDIKEPITSLLVDNVIRVPALVTSYKGEGRIVFEGSDGAKTVTSADVRYYVNKNSGTCDGTIPEPGTPAWQELVGTVKKYSDTAVEAKESAKKSADEAKQALEDTKNVKDQAIENIGIAKDSAIEGIEDKKNTSIEEINKVKESAKKELEDVCNITEDFANQAKESADKAKVSELAAKESEAKSKTSETNSKASENLAEQYKDSASTSAASALESKESASQSEVNAINAANRAAVSEANAKLSETASDNSSKKAFDSETKAKVSEINSANSATNAEHSATNATASADAAKSSADKAKTSEIVSAANTAEVAKNLETIREIKANIDTLDANVSANAASSNENANNARISVEAAKQSETNAALSEASALENKNASAENAAKSQNNASNAKNSADSAKESETKAQEYSNLSQSNANASSESASNAKASEDASKKNADDSAATLQELKDGIASGNFKGDKGDPGPAGADGKDATIDTTLTHEGEAADAKATGEAISAVKDRQNILTGTETGNPIAVDDAFPAPMCGLTVYGKSTQDGTPTPDAPVPIVSAGDGGSLTVKVTGKNLLKIRNGKQTMRGVTVSATDGLISISGTATETGWAVLDIDSFDAPGTVILSSSIDSPRVVLASPTWETVLEQNKSVIATDTIGKICFTVSQGQTYNLTGVKVQLEIGTTVTAYSPYREQLITLPTPNGLPGIPVTSGGNYTDSTGQQWICDEVDLEKGMKMQRVNVVDLSTCFISGTTNLAVTKRLVIRLPLEGRDYKTEALCNKLNFFVSFIEDTPHFYVDTFNAQVFIPIGAKNPEEGEYILFYALAAPIETPLTPAEIAAYKALTAYAPDTVVQASDGAGVKLGYQRDVNIAIKKLEDAVASMT